MKKEFLSRHSNEPLKISAAQYITELVCENKAKKDSKELIKHFWKLPIWEKFFKQQIIAANSLLRIHKDTHIIAAVRNNPFILSLFSKALDTLIKKEALKPVVSEAVPEQPKSIVTRKEYKIKNNLDTLMEL